MNRLIDLCESVLTKGSDCFVDETLRLIDAVLAEPEPREQPSSYPPPPSPRQTPTVRPGAKETR